MVKFKSIQQFTQEDVRSPGDVFRSLTMCSLPPFPSPLMGKYWLPDRFDGAVLTGDWTWLWFSCQGDFLASEGISPLLLYHLDVIHELMYSF